MRFLELISVLLLTLFILAGLMVWVKFVIEKIQDRRLEEPAEKGSVWKP